MSLHETANLRRLAAEMRTNATQTEFETYAQKLRKAADELYSHAALLEQAAND